MFRISVLSLLISPLSEEDSCFYILEGVVLKVVLEAPDPDPEPRLDYAGLKLLVAYANSSTA
jgi:hypothetical protein